MVNIEELNKQINKAEKDIQNTIDQINERETEREEQAKAKNREYRRIYTIEDIQKVSDALHQADQQRRARENIFKILFLLDDKKDN
jgi:hypothetical protein